MLTILQSAESAEQGTFNLEETEALRRDLERWRVLHSQSPCFQRRLLQIPMTAMPCHPCTIGKQDSKVAFEYVSPPSLASNSCHILVNVFLSIGLPAEKIIILPISFCFGAPL